MTITDFRQEYPEYSDMPDSEVMAFIGDEPEEDEKEICAPGIESELSAIAATLTKIVTHISKKEKPEKDDAALIALGLQLQAIEAAIKGIALPDYAAPVVNIPASRTIEYLDVKRDEFNAITRLVPKYA